MIERRCRVKKSRKRDKIKCYMIIYIRQTRRRCENFYRAHLSSPKDTRILIYNICHGARAFLAHSSVWYNSRRNIVQGFHVEFEALEHESDCRGSLSAVPRYGTVIHVRDFANKIPTGIPCTQTLSDTTYNINLINLAKTVAENQVGIATSRKPVCRYTYIISVATISTTRKLIIYSGEEM